jgi:hypothetical protein
MLYFVCLTSRMHLVYHVLRIKEAYILLCFKHMLNYIKRRYSFKVRIFYKDGEIAI